MDLLEFLIIVVILCVILFIVYYYIRGAKGNISLARPVESRVDEYLDRRFQSLVEEWQLVNQSKLQKFKEKNYKELELDEARLLDLKKFEDDMQNTLSTLEARLDYIEKELAQKGSSRK
jgi:predicted Holliday junction resolvase-like endonuclease